MLIHILEVYFLLEEPRDSSHIHLGCFMGFIMHFYITFGTNLLTQSPVPVSVFPLFQCFVEKEYQTESKRNETFGKVIFGK